MGPVRASAPESEEATSSDRRDGVPLQGPEVAVRCPVRAELDHAPTLTPLRRAGSLVQTLRGRAAEEFRSSVVREVTETHHQVAVVLTQPPQDASARAEAEKATFTAIAEGASVVIGPVLPDDADGHRRSSPDLMVRSTQTGDGEPAAGWLPVIVKHHRLTRGPVSESPIRFSSLNDLVPTRSEIAHDSTWRSGPLGDDSLRLAHHWRVLEACGLTPSVGAPVGAVIDKDRLAWWVPLDEPRWNGDDTPPVDALQRYDQRFSLRIAAVANRLQRNLDPAVDRLIGPVRISECDECPWFEVCNTELTATDHVSLVPGFRYDHAAAHQRRGVTTRSDLAQLDWRTAAIAFGTSRTSEPIDLEDLRTAVAGKLQSRPVEHALGPDHHAVPRLREHGVRTVADLLDLDGRTASYSGSAVGHLPSAIDQARAGVTGQVFRARDCDDILVARADVEVDVDMENVDSGVYLWGTYTTRRDGALKAPDLVELTDGYRSFVSWDPIDADRSATVFAEFWRWLSDIRRRTHDAGCTFAAYCYTSAEYEKMRQILDSAPEQPDLPPIEEIDDLIRSPEWVDLYQTVRTSIITGGRLGLKRVAPLAGFSWRDSDPGGEQSMYWHERAVADPVPDTRAEHRHRILTYNEDDVLATLALREWLAEADLPSIEQWEQFRS